MANLLGSPRRRTFPAGTVLIRQGDYGDLAWLIEDGELEIWSEAVGEPKRLAVVGRGAIVGEMALIDDGQRSATVRTLTPVSGLELDRWTFQTLIGQCQPLAAYLLESLVAAIRRAHGLPQPERTEGSSNFRSDRGFERILDRRIFEVGHIFFRQDDAGSAAYLIQDGRVSIRRQTVAGIIELARLGPGRIFGELALLNNAPRRASAVALERTVCEILRKEQFDKTLATMAPILRALTQIYIRQLAPPPKKGAKPED